MRRSRRRSWAPICATCARCWTNTATRPRSTATSATAASTCGSTSICETEDGIRKYGEFVDRAADLVVSYGGSLSGEHGDGQSRGALLPKMFGAELMARVPRVQGGLGSRQQAEPAQARSTRTCRRRTCGSAPTTRRAEPRDAFHVSRRRRIACEGDAAMHRPGRVPQARLRHDVPELHGDARRGAQHARPRAHAVRDAAGRGGAATAGRTSTSSEALDLCLSCKACKSECPTNVDIATYRAEFLSHYYEGRRRPLHAYAFGMIDRWLRARVASRRGWPTSSTDAPGLSHARAARAAHRARAAAAAARAGQFPAVGATARRSARWRRSRRPRPRRTTAGHGDPVGGHVQQLLPSGDEPGGASRAQRAGFDVAIPAQRLCCGRPLYDFGLLDRAKQYLRTIMDELGEAIDAGVPMVVLEPSCASVFRDELRNLFPERSARDAAAQPDVPAVARFLESRRRRRTSRRGSRGRCCSTAIAIRRRS